MNTDIRPTESLCQDAPKPLLSGWRDMLFLVYGIDVLLTGVIALVAVLFPSKQAVIASLWLMALLWLVLPVLAAATFFNSWARKVFLILSLLPVIVLVAFSLLLIFAADKPAY